MYTAGTGAVDILSILTISVVSSKVSSSVILNNPSCSDSISILFSQCWSILLFIYYATSIDCLPDGLKL